ncbi:18198_t:CDS:2 [Acaulospora morrowiae]|uniref:18198_t:CDS:1 n=1 Tax=Acaulospora morrowiae TaxID=94023 RepID=A0A9N9FJQ8_9GLOM|nr:18198_t:CDS:2 [Acaulospora morrowiae]
MGFLNGIRNLWGTSLSGNKWKYKEIYVSKVSEVYYNIESVKSLSIVSNEERRLNTGEHPNQDVN